MDHELKLSIITPVYNGSKYFGQALNAIKDQTFTDFEWIIINDCSTDNTLDLLKAAQKNEPRIVIIDQVENGGPIIARNSGMDAAQGRYIAFLDMDDLWHPSKLEKQINFMKEQKLALSYTGFKKMDDSGKIKSRVSIPVPRKITYDKLVHSNSIVASSAMFDRELTGDVRQDIAAPISKDDFFLWLEILKSCGPAKGINEGICYLRVHSGSITNDKLEMARRHWRMYRDIFKFSRLKTIRVYTVYSIKGLCKYLM